MTLACSMIDSRAAPDFGQRASEPIVILIDGDRRVIDASRAAEALLDEATAIERNFGRLAAPCQCDMARIERAMTEARWRGIASMRLDRDAFEADIVRMNGILAKPGFLVIARQRKGTDRAERAARCYGLTPAENRLLSCLLEGLELKDAAFRLGVARTTARTHLQRIFDKTGVRRQTDLQRVIALA